jgi:hypothetical protein
MIFVSHDSRRIKEAHEFVRLTRKHQSRIEVPNIFLSSDASSIRSGEPWVCRIFQSLKDCKRFVALLVDSADFENRWIPFEAAYVMGREIDVQVFVFGQLRMKDVPWPLGALHLIDTGDSGRVQIALSSIGVKWTQEMENEFAHLFRQCGCYRVPREHCDAEETRQ